MRTSSPSLSIDSASLMRKIIVAEVYEQNDPSFEPLHSTMQIDECVRCLDLVQAVIIFREAPPAALALISACDAIGTRVAAMTADNDLIVGLCGECLRQFYDLEVLPN